MSAQYIQSMLLQRGSQTALLPLPVDIGLTAAAKLGSSMLLFAITFTGQLCTAALCLFFALLAILCSFFNLPQPREEANSAVLLASASV